MGSLRDHGPRMVTVDMGAFGGGFDTTVQTAEGVSIAVEDDGW